MGKLTPKAATTDRSWAWAALDAAPIATLVLDQAGTIVFANARCERTLGRSPSELTGIRLDALLAPECQSRLGADLRALLEAPPGQEQSPDRQLVALDSSGGHLAIELSLSRLAAAGPPLIVAVIRDITRQKAADERQTAVTAEAQQERARLEALLEFAPAFILAISPAGTIDFINRTLPQHPKKEVIGRNWLSYFAPDLHELMESKLREAYATGLTQTYEVVTPGPDGNPLWFESHMAPILVAGQTVGVVLVSQDVSERKRAQAELLAGRHLALLGTLAAGVAHEINTPIQFVGDSVQFLREAAQALLLLLEKLGDLRQAALSGGSVAVAVAAADKAEEEADLPYVRQNMPAAFDRCVDGLARVANIVRSLKEFAHPAEKDMVAADLNRAIQAAVTIATNEYKFVADLQTDLGELPAVTCHASEISQTVLNMIVNASHAIGDVVKGTDRKGLITVRTRQDGDAVVIAISDTGGGIPESIQSRIFDPFFTTKEVGKGTGQGLAIAWSSIHDRHGGGITFETKLGEGTTFSIRLPITGKVTAQ